MTQQEKWAVKNVALDILINLYYFTFPNHFSDVFFPVIFFRYILNSKTQPMKRKIKKNKNHQFAPLPSPDLMHFCYEETIKSYQLPPPFPRDLIYHRNCGSCHQFLLGAAVMSYSLLGNGRNRLMTIQVCERKMETIERKVSVSSMCLPYFTHAYPHF